MQHEYNLTRKQQEIYDFLLKHHTSHANPLTLDELCSKFGTKSRGSMHKHIQALVDSDLIEPAHGKQRGIRLTKQILRSRNELPLVGYIAAGQPIEAIPVPERITVPKQLTGQGTCYVLQIQGDSMIEDGILDGDWVVIEERSIARNGEIVVALIEGGEVTLKHIEQRPGKVILHPANSTMEPMVFRPDQIDIQGVLIGQMRSYKSY